MSQDLLSILTGQSAKSAPTQKGSAQTYDPVDAAIRTIYGEAAPDATREERQAIASVIVNRARESGLPFDQVVQQPGQFEPWQNPKARKRIEALTSDDPTYKAIAADVGDVLGGKANPYPDLTHFYAPAAQKALASQDGRPERPEWDDGSGRAIGSHLFFAKGQEGGAAKGTELIDILGSSGAQASSGDDSEAAKAFAATFGDPKKYGDPDKMVSLKFEDNSGVSNPKQGATILGMGELYRKDAEAGTEHHPYVLPQGKTEKDVPPGAYYVPAEGGIKRAPGGDDRSSVLKGLERGVGDVGLSVLNLTPGLKDSELRRMMAMQQELYDAGYKGDLASGLGRFTGQVIGSAPALAGAEGLVAPALTKFAGPAGEFLLGRAGAKALPETAGALERLAQIATRGGSLAASGAAEGAGASALTSSASEQPLSEQLKTGALLGGTLKPVGSAVVSGVRRFTGGNPLKGAAEIQEQAALADAAKSLPVQVPLSLGQITRAPAQQMSENAMLRGANGDLAAGVVQAFRNDQQGALRANTKAIGDLVAGREFTPGEGAKSVSERLNTMRDNAKKAIDAAYDEARARGDDAMLATAAEVREGALDGLRRDYNLDRIPSVAGELERFGEKGAPTVRELFDMRSRLSKLTQSNDGVESGAARQAVRAVDAYTDTALKNDLFLGDPAAVKAWKEAVRKRSDFGRLFEGDDLIEGLTERVNRGGGSTLKVDPDEAANYILNRSELGWVGKKNLTRDLKRLQGVLGKDSDEWNGLRAEVFSRLARAGEGAPEGGVPQFSGQKFLKAWEKAKREDPQVVNVMFTPEERDLLDKFGEVSQVVTTPVKGGDNSSNSAITAKRFLEPMGRFLSIGGGAGGGAAVGGVPGAALGAAFGSLMKELGEILAAGKARRVTYGAKPVVDTPRLQNKLIPSTTLPAAGAITGGAQQSQPKQ